MRFLFAVAIFTIIGIACNKRGTVEDDGYVYITGSGLVGKWLAKESFVSPGGGTILVDLPRDKWFTMEFKADSSFTYSANFPKADSLFSQYSLSGYWMSVSSLVNSKTDRWYYDLGADDKLELGIFMCFEGCSYLLRRIQ